MPTYSESSTSGSSRSISRSAVTAFYLALASGGLAMVGALGSRWGWWPFRIGFILMLVSMLAGLAAIVFSVIGLISARPGRARRGFLYAVVGLLVSLAVVGLPLNLIIKGLRLPPIHDITTDTDNPPRFVAILPLRRDADNPSDYGGPEIAAQQHKAYPNVRAATLQLKPDQAFERALSVAREMGWNIVEASPTDGRIEATARTFWFGFKDDVIIRVTPAGTGSRIDVRSVSRIGKSDVGANAKRIEDYIKRLTSNG